MNKKWASILRVHALFLIMAFAGCVEPVSYPELVSAPQPPAIVLPTRYRIVGTSVQGRPIMSLVLSRGPDVTFIMASIHGNEPAGTPLVRRLAKHLQEHPQLLAGRMVVLLPTANPDGIARNSRYNAHGVDLNRNFAAANRLNNQKGGPRALSEPEARAIEQLILKYPPDRIVSIHQPLACIDYDGPGQMIANHMAQYCDLPVKKLGAQPGSLGSYAGVTLGIPIITLEMLKTDSQLDSETLWQRYGKALLAAIVYPDPIQ
jgi:protein MpaA